VNDDYDTEAKSFWKDEEDKGTKAALMKLSDEAWALLIGDENTSTQFQAMMYNHIYDPYAVKSGRNVE
jgi:hypothetical protein